MPRISQVHCMNKTFGDHCRGCQSFVRERYNGTANYFCTKKDIVS